MLEDAVITEDLDSAEFAHRLKAAPDAVLLDVRTPAEFENGRIPNARNVDISDPGFLETISALDRNRTYLVYCRSGNRSTTACRVMAQLGFRRVYNLANGIIDWDGAIEYHDWRGG